MYKGTIETLKKKDQGFEILDDCNKSDKLEDKDPILPINEIFQSIQGEGKRAGVPSIFVRVSGCNLRCCFRNPDGGVTTCDTPYTSHSPEKPKSMSVKDAVGKVKELLGYYPEVRHIVLTGGEPLLYQDGIVALLDELDKEREDLKITIETNGTITPNLNLLGRINLWSVSPKLSTSAYFIEGCGVPKALQDQHNKLRINSEALRAIVEDGYDCQFKFVWTGPECEKEIDLIISDILNVDPKHFLGWETTPEDKKTCERMMNITLMPQGITPEEISANSQEMVDCCLQRGWRYSDRLHIRLWGNKRGV